MCGSADGPNRLRLLGSAAVEPQFQTAFERHLLPEQRRAVLQTLAARVPQDATVGELVDAARALGWSEPMGTLTLQDFANALLGAKESEPDVDREVKPAPVAASQGVPEREAPMPAPPAKAAPEKAPEKASKKASKKKAASKATAKTSDAALESLKARLDADEPMSLEEAAEVLVPIVSNLGTATMQQLDEFTGIGRRKLRFHIGQLVRHEYLERHGMGRGTYYTACE